MTEPIRYGVTVSRSRDAAFALFIEQLGAWWPREYTWGQDVLEEIGIEPRLDGLCFERGPHGFRCDWGRVIAWEPPHRFAIAWQIGPHREPVPDPERASAVEVRFEQDGSDLTRVTLEHRGFERHGEDADAYRTGLAAPEGWPYILSRFAAFGAAADRS